MTDQPAPRRQPNTRKKSDAVRGERDNLIWALKLQGLSTYAIGEDPRVNLSHTQVSNIIAMWTEKRIFPKVDEYRIVHIERLEGLWAALAPGRDEGDPQSANASLKVLERQAKLLGLDAPTKLDANITNDETDAMRALAAEAARRVADVPVG